MEIFAIAYLFFIITTKHSILMIECPKITKKNRGRRDQELHIRHHMYYSRHTVYVNNGITVVTTDTGEQHAYPSGRPDPPPGYRYCPCQVFGACHYLIPDHVEPTVRCDPCRGLGHQPEPWKKRKPRTYTPYRAPYLGMCTHCDCRCDGCSILIVQNNHP